MLTFRFFCLINLFVVSYSIFVLFCVHVAVERNTGGQGVIHRKCQKGGTGTRFLDGYELRKRRAQGCRKSNPKNPQRVTGSSDTCYLWEILARDPVLGAPSGGHNLIWQHQFYFNDLITTLSSRRNWSQPAGLQGSWHRVIQQQWCLEVTILAPWREESPSLAFQPYSRVNYLL